MTIKELEAASGMGRANIRFYEKEGLLCPARQENGYRDYTTADLAELEKIRLLRVLEVPLEDIRQLQTGQLTLAAVLHRQASLLEQSAHHLASVQAVCRQMQTDAAGYDTLDASLYLRILQNGLPPDSDRVHPLQDPWRRYFARSFDFLLYGLCINLLLVLLGVNLSAISPILDLIRAPLIAAVMLCVEPLLLHRFGTTPGKALLGLRVTSWDGSLLTRQAALDRTANLLHNGWGWAVPFWSQFCLIRSYLYCKEEKPLIWEEDSTQTLKKPAPWRTLVLVLSVATIFAVTGVLVLAGNLPRHWGDLTPAQFADNFNYLADQDEQQHDPVPSYTLDETGAVQPGLISADYLPAYQYTLDEDGRITAIRMELSYQGDADQILEATWDSRLPFAYADRALALRSFAGARYFPFTKKNTSQVLLEQLDQYPLENWQLTGSRVLVTQEVTTENLVSTLWGPTAVEDAPVFFHLVFTMEKLAG